jgi:hypothetical protein
MKNTKVLATIVVLSLFLATFAAIPIVFRANAVTMYHLDVYTDPSAVPIPAGTGDYTLGTWVNLTATDPYISGGVKYIFSYWDVDGSGSFPNPHYVYMDADHNATAHYTIQYKVTLTPNPFVALGVLDWMWSTATGWVQTNSEWVDSGAQAEVGVTGLTPNAPDGIYVNPSVWAYLVNFTGAAASNYHTGSLPPEIWASDPFTVTGPCTAGSNWAFQYLLLVSSSTNPPPNPAGTGWYNAGTIVTLTAPDIVINWAAHYTLSYWQVDLVTVAGNPIFVTMNTNHTAVAFYKRQSFIFLADNVGNFSGIQDTGKWYDDGVVYTFMDIADLYPAANMRYDFRLWEKVGDAWWNSSNPLHVIFDNTWDGYTLRADYQGQYYLTMLSSPALAGFLEPDSATTGWYDWSTTQRYDAVPIITINPTTRYVFVNWTNQYGGFDLLSNNTFTLSQPYILTAYYKLQYLATWTSSPTSITVAGFPGQTWIDSGTDIWYTAPATDTTTQFAFYYWVINSVTYAQGVNPAHVGIMTGPVSGTAYYANQTKIFFSPGLHTETSPAYCHTFNITISAANFDANRIVSGQPMDIYGFDFIVTWDPTYLEVTNVYLNLAAFFAPNAYFIAVNTVNNVAGTYELAATVKGNFTGFSGTKDIVTLTFHVINDLIYPGSFWKYIGFSQLQLQNHLGNFIWPELSWTGTWYNLNTVMPMVEIRNQADHSNLVKIDMNVPQQFFNVEGVLHDGVQVEDFDIVVYFPQALINVVSITIGTYLQPPFITYYAHFDNVAGFFEVWVVQDPSVPQQNGTGLLFTVQFKVVNQIYYKLTGPFTLPGVIQITYAKLSTSSGDQYYPTVGVINCNYVYNPLPGDLNFDGRVDVLDLQIIADHWNMAMYDLFGDGKCDLNDLVFVALRFGTHI